MGHVSTSATAPYSLRDGPGDRAYFLFGLRYQALLAREGIDATVRPTSGSVENIHLLQKGGEVDVALSKEHRSQH
jgi:TRAP-type uncharacterized transport system substrate-binding protein